jgi:hypothetical protein
MEENADQLEKTANTEESVSPFQRILSNEPITPEVTNDANDNHIAAINKRLIDSRFSKLFALPSHVIPDVTVLCNSFLSTMIGGIAASRPTQHHEKRLQSKRRKLNHESVDVKDVAEDPFDPRTWSCHLIEAKAERVEEAYDFESENVMFDFEVEVLVYFSLILSLLPLRLMCSFFAS